MSPIDLPKIYNPHNQTRDELIDNFVVRMGIFQDIFEDIRTSKMVHPEQNYIIQGVRGQGKTSLLLRIVYEIEKDNTLNRKIIPVIFSEEQYKIRKLFKLWEETAFYLKKHQGFEYLYQEMQNLEYDDDFEEKSYCLLERTLQKNKKKLILFIDNIADMLHKFTLQEHRRLREILIESAEIRIIGASAESLEFHHDYSKPFYQFFKMPILKGLNQKETNTLLLSLGKKYKRDRVRNIVENESGRVEALRRMTGGVIRTIIILYQIFVDNENGNAFQDLEKILDEVTPLYKHRMEILSPQQQEIVEIIALNWDAISAKEIADKAREQSKAISAQLKVLVNNYIIEKQKTNTKNHLYRLTERFFNIWYLMRYGSKDEELKVKWLVEFLLCWCDEKTLIDKAERHINAIHCGGMYENHALYMTEALSCALKDRELQNKLVQETRKYLETQKHDLLEYLHPSDNEMKQKAYEYFNINDFEQTVKNLEKIRIKTGDDYYTLGNIYQLKMSDFQKAEKYYLLAVQNEVVEAMYNLALLYHTEFKDFKKAEKYYLMAIKKEDVEAMNNLAILYETEFKDILKAEKYYLLAIEKEHAGAMNNLAILYQAEYKDFLKAEKYYLLAIEKEHAGAMFNLAFLYQSEFKNFQKAEKYYLLAIKKEDVEAMNNLALLYENEFKDFQKAEKYYLMAIKKEDAGAMNNLALLYETEIKDFQKAEIYYLMAIEKEGAMAMNNLAILYQAEYKDFLKAEKYYLLAIEKEHAGAMFNLAFLYQSEFKDFLKAEKYYLLAIEKEHAGAMYNLAFLYRTEFKDFQKAEKYYLLAAGHNIENAWNAIAWMFFDNSLDKEKALKYVAKGYKAEKNIINSYSYSMILLWNNEIEKALEISNEFLLKTESFEKYPNDVTDFLMLLIAKKQYHSALRIFQENPYQLKDRYKPVYYALMYFLQNEYPNEYIKMGSELKQTVEELIEEIGKLAKKYI